MVVKTKTLATKRQPDAKRRLASQTTTQSRPASSNRAKRRRLFLSLTILIVSMTIIGWMLWPGQIPQAAPTIDHQVVNSFPHDPEAYTQGLTIHNGMLFEGTGGNGRSSLRKVDLQTGKILQQHDLDRRLFGEGIAIWKNRILQLTWRSQKALVYELETFREIGRFPYRGEGWGLTHDGKHLIMSDGSSTLRFLNPDTFQVVRQLSVRDGRRRIRRLNELEFVEGEILANVWYDDRIAVISPATGKVKGWINLARLFPVAQRPHSDAVLNGIAYDPDQQRLFVTGKHWPRLYEIRLVDPDPSQAVTRPR